VPRSVVLGALVTDDASFLAADVEPKGCLNSALFCEQLVASMREAFGPRLTVVENLPVSEVILREADADLITTGPRIVAKRVVLCTNGFENFRIANLAGDDINPRFHATVQGVIGYMAGYTEPRPAPATAISYVRDDRTTDAYHYLTRRPYGAGEASLLCIGGPERPLPAAATYESDAPFPAAIEEELSQALRGVYRDLDPKARRDFLWHGLMGYTPTGVRRIGYEPKNRVLLYNLGCNGVGILPSVYGGKRIAQLLSGMELPDSLFDPD
jgi:glycine/D-amino acid oxidase-like deaminating enzyme